MLKIVFKYKTTEFLLQLNKIKVMQRHKNMYSGLKFVLLFFNWTLVVLSTISLLFVLNNAFQLPFDSSLSLIGFETFFNIISTFSLLYGATFIVLTTIFTIDRLGIMKESNDNSWLSNNRNIWFQILKEVIGPIKEDDPRIYRDILTKSMLIHDHLFDTNYCFRDQADLKCFYDKFTKGVVHDYEKSNYRYDDFDCYKNADQSYSFYNYIYVINYLINTDESYAGWKEDLKELYMIDVKSYNHDKINSDKLLIHMKQVEISVDLQCEC